LQNHAGKILLNQRPSLGIWGGLWSFPELDNTEDPIDFCKKNIGDPIECTSRPSFRHTFSHYHLDITPVYIKVEQLISKIADDDRQQWLAGEQWRTRGLPAPVKKLLDSL
jgi:A/G-specific adenine glycosylase